MLFFRDQADEANVDGIDDQLCIPADRLVSMSPASDTTIEMLFRSVKNNDMTHNEQLTYDKVTLTVKEGDIQEALDGLVRTINGHPNSNGFIVIADDCATTDSATSSLNDQTISTVYCHPSITGVASITVANKLYRTQMPSIGVGNAAMTGISATELSVNTAYKGATATALAMTLPSAAAGKAGDWITVLYTTAINNGAAHTYTCTTDTNYAPGSIIYTKPGGDDNDSTRPATIDESTTNDDIITITGLTDGDGGIGTILKFVNMTGKADGWAAYVEVEGRDKQNAAATAAFSAG
tara:strand:- start:468 stop:1352 length:885 start_codon:yes stop_codon:yes gene_type:complete